MEHVISVKVMMRFEKLRLMKFFNEKALLAFTAPDPTSRWQEHWSISVLNLLKPSDNYSIIHTFEFRRAHSKSQPWDFVFKLATAQYLFNMFNHTRHSAEKIAWIEDDVIVWWSDNCHWNHHYHHQSGEKNNDHSAIEVWPEWGTHKLH